MLEDSGIKGGPSCSSLGGFSPHDVLWRIAAGLLDGMGRLRCARLWALLLPPLVLFSTTPSDVFLPSLHLSPLLEHYGDGSTHLALDITTY